jgi:hypothetical protein
MIDAFIDPDYFPAASPDAEAAERKLQDAAYWLESIVQRLDSKEPEHLEVDLEELCHILGVKPPVAKLTYA